MTKKFRIWDKLAQSFILPDKGYQGHFVLDLNGRFYNLQNGSGGDEYIVQQWTGLTDSQGVEIYEGDILDLCGYIENIRYEESSGAYIFFDDFASLFTEKAKIIGNIFQTPELLEKS